MEWFYKSIHWITETKGMAFKGDLKETHRNQTVGFFPIHQSSWESRIPELPPQEEK